MEDSLVLKRETELRKRNEELAKNGKKSETIESSKICSTEKLDLVITESEVTRRSTNAVKKFEKAINPIMTSLLLKKCGFRLYIRVFNLLNYKSRLHKMQLRSF